MSKEKYEKLQKQIERYKKAMETDRFKKVMAFLVHKGLLLSNGKFNYVDEFDIGDALWAAKYEPRILEVLPAAVIHFPKSIVDVEKLPKQLMMMIEQIKKNHDIEMVYKGIQYKDMRRWANIKLKDRRTKPLSEKKIQQNFRLSPAALDNLNSMAISQGLNRTEVIEKLLNT
jgi:hypothetical protein